MTTVVEPLFLKAFQGTNQRVPVWFMRQAGRYLPDYQAMKTRYSLQEMFQTPELAAEITCQPIDILGVDAAILFADILTLPAQMGFDISFEKKWRIGNCITSPKDVEQLHDFEDLSHITKTIQLINERLSDDIPLIGFAGSPFTVLTYLIEGGSTTTFHKTLRFIRENRETFHKVMSLLTENTIRYLNLQKKAGIKAFQLFDTWAGILPPAEFSHCVLPYVQLIFESINLPSIYFVRQSNPLLPLMDKSDADFLSVDHTVVLGHHSVIERTKKGIQGNLFNGLLYADYPTLKREIHDVLIGGKKHGRYIFNLSHGIFPDVDVDKLKFIVDEVHAFNWNQ